MAVFIDKNELIEQGYPKHTAQNIIRQSKKLWYNEGIHSI